MTVTEAETSAVERLPERAPRCARRGDSGRARRCCCCSRWRRSRSSRPSLNTLGRIVYFALLAASLDLLVGITGLPSLAHAGFFAVGAYTAGLVAQDVSRARVVVRARGACWPRALAAAVTGWLAVRSRGIFFLMLTLAIGEIIFLLAESLQDVTGGSNGLFGIPADRDRPRRRRALTQPALQVLVRTRRLRRRLRSCCGRSRARRSASSLRGIHDNEERMRALGYSPRRYKFVAFCIAGAVAGLAGALLAAHQQVRHARRRRVRHRRARARGGRSSAARARCGGRASAPRSSCSSATRSGPSLGGHGPLLLGVVFVARRLPAAAAASRALPDAAPPEARMTRAARAATASRASSAACAPSTASTCGSPAGARHGLIGPNGAGKSTLFKLILGAEPCQRRPGRASPAATSPASPSTSACGSASPRRSSTRACSSR